MRGALAPLTSAEQALAEQNLFMVDRFLASHHLPAAEWYDVVIFRYLLTVQKWFRQPELYQYAFSTIAWKAMQSAVGNERKKADRRIQTISLEAPVPGTNGLTWADTITEENRIQ